MDAGKATAVRVDRQAPARRNGTVCNEIPAFTLLAETEVFQEEQGIDGEGVIELDDVYIRWAHLRHIVGQSARLLCSRHSEIVHGGDLPIPYRGATAQHIHRLLLERLRTV